jgi:hypothetical protein
MFEALSQLFRYMKANGKLWMAPVILGLLALGGLLVIVQASAVAPLLYAIF